MIIVIFFAAKKTSAAFHGAGDRILNQEMAQITCLLLFGGADITHYCTSTCPQIPPVPPPVPLAITLIIKWHVSHLLGWKHSPATSLFGNPVIGYQFDSFCYFKASDTFVCWQVAMHQVLKQKQVLHLWLWSYMLLTWRLRFTVLSVI